MTWLDLHRVWMIGAVGAVAVLLAWADSTLFRPVFPQPFAPPRRIIVRERPPELALTPIPLRK